MNNNLDQLTRTECCDFIRLAIHKGDPKFARSLAGTIKNICQSGQANREEIWADLKPQEQERFRLLVAGEPANHGR